MQLMCVYFPQEHDRYRTPKKCLRIVVAARCGQRA
jgi:hypothetical protein